MKRRDFLAAGAAGTMLGGYFINAQEKKPRVGLIGCGWYGKSDLCRLIQVAPVEVVSLCDVDKKMLEGAAELIASRQQSKKQPRTFGDYRQMLKEKDLDIVLVGTPDHWHSTISIDAMNAGKDVYCEKPMVQQLAEGKQVIDAQNRTGRIFQVGSQRVSSVIYAKA